MLDSSLILGDKSLGSYLHIYMWKSSYSYTVRQNMAPCVYRTINLFSSPSMLHSQPVTVLCSGFIIGPQHHSIYVRLKNRAWRFGTGMGKYIRMQDQLVFTDEPSTNRYSSANLCLAELVFPKVSNSITITRTIAGSTTVASHGYPLDLVQNDQFVNR